MELQIPPHAFGLESDLVTALQAAQAAAIVVRKGAQGLPGLANFEQKSPGDLVSEVDLAADRAASAVIRAASDIPILSEELCPDQGDATDLWVIDPLDGSGAYLMQAGPQFPAVLVARRHRGATTCGVCLFPMTDEWFYAVRGQGAWRNGEPLRVRPSRKLRESWVETNRYGDPELETEEFTHLTRRLRSASGAGLVTCNAPYSGVAMRIVEGHTALSACIHDNSPHCVKQAAWDIAAPQLILEEAGGVLCNLRGESIHPFSAEVMIVAQSRQIADEILNLTRNRVVAAA